MKRLTVHAADLAAYALFFLLAGILLWPVLLRGEILLPAQYIAGFYPWRGESSMQATMPAWNALQADSILQYLPWRQFTHTSLHAGTLPLWNPHQFCGTPFIANYQSAIFYPLNLLFWLLPAARAFGFSALLHLFLAGAFLYLYLRGRGLRRLAALCGGITFELCGFLVAWLELPTAVNVMVWLPLALFFYERSRAGQGWLRGLPAALPLAMILLAGHPQFALYALFSFIAYALALLPPGESRGERLRALAACLALPLALAGMIAAAQALPVLELSRLSHRAGGSLLAASAAGYQRQALPFWAAIVLLLPRFFGSPAQGNAWGPANYAEFVGYAGVLPLLLAALLILGLAVPGWRARITAALPEGAPRRIWFFIALALLAVAAGFNTPLGTLFYSVAPGFGGFGSPGRMLSLFSLALAILCGFGIHLLLESPSRALTRPILAAAAVTAAGATVLLLAAVQGAAALGAGDPGTILSQSADSCTRFFGLLLLGALVLALGNSGQLSPALSRGILPALVTLDLLAFAWGFNPTAPAALAYPPSPVLSALRARAPYARFLAITPRWTLDQFPVAVLPPNGATACGLNDINGYDSLYLAAYKELLNQTGGRESSPQANGNMVLFDAVDAPGFRELGCEYVLTLLPLADRRFTLVQDGPVLLYRFGGALPRAFLANEGGDKPLPGGEARVIEENATRLRLKLHAPRGCVLSLRDAFYPGWRAQVDGKPTAITRDHGAFRAIAIPAGAREVQFRYQPMSFRMGLFLSLLALGCLAGAAGFRYVKS